MEPHTSKNATAHLDQPRTVVFFGISGAGKGTQADLLVRYLAAVDPTRRVVRVDQGALLRSRASHDDDLGRRVTAIIAAGELVPNFVATGLLAEYVSKNYSAANHFVFDGVARYDLQAQTFEELMVFFDRADWEMVVLELSEQEARKRLALRGRDDEATDEQRRRRFRWWAEKTLPAIELLEKKGRKVHRIEGSMPVERVHEAILGTPASASNFAAPRTAA